MPLVNILLLAILIEAVVSAIKPIWSKDGEKMSVAEIVSICLGVALCVSCRINMLEYIVDWDLIDNSPPWVPYIFYTLTGIALGRGPSFLWDLWQRMKKFTEKDAVLLGGIAPVSLKENGEVDLNIDNWSLQQLAGFCELNNIPAEGCTTRDDFINRIEHYSRVSDEPPTDGGEE